MRWKESNTLVALAASFHLRRAALCCEERCESVFDLVLAKSPRTVRCPHCGGSSWRPLPTIVPSLRMAPGGIRLSFLSAPKSCEAKESSMARGGSLSLEGIR
jgi:hypothetical protein